MEENAMQRTITESRRDEHRECVHAKMPVRHGYKLTTAKGYREEKPRTETIRPPAEERSQTWIQGEIGKRGKKHLPCNRSLLYPFPFPTFLLGRFPAHINSCGELFRTSSLTGLQRACHLLQFLAFGCCSFMPYHARIYACSGRLLGAPPRLLPQWHFLASGFSAAVFLSFVCPVFTQSQLSVLCIVEVNLRDDSLD